MENSEVISSSRRLESWLFSLNNSMSDFKIQNCFNVFLFHIINMITCKNSFS